MKKLNTEIFAERLSAINNNLEVVSEYTGYHDDITCRCKIDGNEWSAKACHFLDGSTTCSVCRQRNNSQRLDYKGVMRRINQKNEYIEIINKYVNEKTPLDLYCKKHDYYFSKRIPTKNSTSLLCDLCNFEAGRANYKLSNDVYKKILEFNNCQFVSSDSENGKIFLSYICNNHIKNGIQRDSLINIKRRKNICQFCNGKVKNEEMFIEKLHKIQPNIDLIGNYIAARKRVHVICNACGNDWNPFAYNLLGGFGCPVCNVSKGENEIKKYLDTHNINYIQYYKLFKGKGTSYLSLDFYLQDYCIGIEYDGEQHYHPVNWDGKTPEDVVLKRFETQKHNDQLKNDYCKKNNIELIRISYLEKDRITDILDFRLNNILTSSSA